MSQKRSVLSVVLTGVSVEVADELQGRGIGTALAERVVRHARMNGFSMLTATALWENRPARALLRRLEFHPRRSTGGVIELELELDSMSGGVAGAAS